MLFRSSSRIGKGHFLAASLFTLALSVFAQPTRAQQITAAEGNSAFECHPEYKRPYCIYLVGKTSAWELKKKAQAIFYPSYENIGSPVELLDIYNDGAGIIFWSGQFLEDLKRFLATEDKIASFIVPPQINIVIKWYFITATGRRDFDFGLKALTFGSTDLGTDKSATANPDGSLDVGLQMGSASLKFLLRAGTLKKQIRYVDSAMDTTTNDGQLSITRLSTQYIVVNPNAISDHSEDVGIRASGKVSLNANDPDGIVISNFYLSYGISLSSTQVQTLRVPKDKLFLKKGVPQSIVSHTQVKLSSLKQAGVSGLGRGSQDEETSVLFTIMAYDRLPSTPQPPPIELGLDNLPHGNFDPKVLNQWIPFDDTLDPGSPVLGLRLPTSIATVENLSTKVHIEVEGFKAKQSQDMDIHELISQGFRFDLNQMLPEDWEKSSIVVKMKFSPAVGSGDKFKTVKQKFVFNPRNFKLEPFRE